MCKELEIDPVEDVRALGQTKLILPFSNMNTPRLQIEILIIAWKFKAKTNSQFSKEEFEKGMADLGCVTHSLEAGRGVLISSASLGAIISSS